MLRRLATALLAVLAAGCSSPESGPGEPETFWSFRSELRLPGPNRVDLLFLVDSSGSMAAELEVVPDRVRAMVRALQEPARNERGEGPPVMEDLEVGLATARPGGRGELLWAAESMESGCESDRRPLWDDAAEAAAAIEPGGGEARGLLDAGVELLSGPSFARERSLLALVVVTDGDDASAGPVDAFADALLALRPQSNELVVFGAVAGVPTDGSWTLGRPLDELRDLGEGSSCQSERAAPPLRLAEAAQGFGWNGMIESICREDWLSILGPLSRRVQSRAALCLPRDGPELAAERCGVTLLRAEACPCPPGTEDLGLDEEGRRECALAEGAWWQLDGSSRGCDGAELVVPSFDDLPPGSLLVECWGELSSVAVTPG